jgi:hypothetical protein
VSIGLELQGVYKLIMVVLIIDSINSGIPVPSVSGRDGPALLVDCEGTSAPPISYDATV